MWQKPTRKPLMTLWAASRQMCLRSHPSTLSKDMCSLKPEKGVRRSDGSPFTRRVEVVALCFVSTALMKWGLKLTKEHTCLPMTLWCESHQRALTQECALKRATKDKELWLEGYTREFALIRHHPDYFLYEKLMNMYYHHSSVIWLSYFCLKKQKTKTKNPIRNM